MTKDTPGEYFNSPIWDQVFYKRCHKGAGYYKFTVEGVTITKSKALVSLRSRHKNHIVHARFTLKDKLLVPEIGFWFNSPWEYFVKMESKNIIAYSIKKTHQYQHELKEQQNKYPEKFL